jgi:hypothetical protein
MRPRGAVTIGGDAAGAVVVVDAVVVGLVVVVVGLVVVVVVVVDGVVDVVVIDGVVTARGLADELHAALAITSTAPAMLRPRRRCTAS